MAVKKREAIEAARRAFAKLQNPSGASTVHFVDAEGSAPPAAQPSGAEPRTPEFEVGGWHFFAKTGIWEDEPTDGGDADFRAPDGAYVALVWTATGRSCHHFDFTPSFGPMLDVEVPRAVTSWDALRLQLEAMVPAIEAEYLARDRRR